MSHDRMVLHEVCAAAAALVTQPMDVVKTRMQETVGSFCWRHSVAEDILSSCFFNFK